MSAPRPVLLLIGCGKMGGALLQGWLKQDIATSITVIDPSPVQRPPHPQIHYCADVSELDTKAQFDAVIIAIKPQQLAGALSAYQRFSNSLFLSIAAGQTLEKLAQYLGNKTPIIRAMPNLPASVGASMSVAIANQNATSSHKALAEKLLGSIGHVEWIRDETLMDAVTALSGSGPAYVFALVEAMGKAGTALGLDRAMAERLARQTLIGSAALLQDSTQSATELRQAVTSPGGTTEAALEKLLDPREGLDPLLDAAMKAAEERGRFLANKG